jgi:hypothetical protein
MRTGYGRRCPGKCPYAHGGSLCNVEAEQLAIARLGLTFSTTFGNHSSMRAGTLVGHCIDA